MENESNETVATSSEAKTIRNLESIYRDLNCDIECDERGKVSSLVLSWDFFWEHDAENAAAQLAADNLAPFMAVWSLSHLQKLELYEFQHHSIPNEIGHLKKTLRDFTLRDCDNLTHISSEIGLLENLTSFRLINCKRLERIPSEIGQLGSLAVFRIVDCKRLERIPTEIGQLKNLKSFRLANCTRLDGLPAELWNLEGLEDFVLRGSTFQTFPSEIVRLQNLKCLSVFQNSNLQTLPPEIGFLTSLESLSIGHNENLQSLPPGIGSLKTLKSLAVVDNASLRTLPGEIGLLESLKYLTIEACVNLNYLPPELCQLRKLESISLNRLDALQTLPEDFASSLHSLKHLTMKRCTGLVNLDNLSMAGLQRLRLVLISGCTGVDNIPLSLQTAAAPKRLNLSGMRRDTVVKFFRAPWAGEKKPPKAIILDGAVRGVDGAGRIDNKDIPWNGRPVDPLEYNELVLGSAYSSILPGLPNSLVELSLAEQGIENLNGFVQAGLPRGLRTLWLQGNPILKSTKDHDRECLVKILAACPQLCRLCLSTDQSLFSQAALVSLCFNRCGRILLSDTKPIALSVWPTVLERVKETVDPCVTVRATVLYKLLRGPSLLQRQHGSGDPVTIRKRKAADII
jgi:Leucine-rich repeat (LRR) protein